MSDNVVIIGSGFAARQLVKHIRKLDAHLPVTLIAGDSADEYNKPELSHVISRGQHADDLTRQTGAAFAQAFNLTLHAHTQVTSLDPQRKTVSGGGQTWAYSKLVLATGAKARILPVPGGEDMITLNSQAEFRRYETRLFDARRILVVGGGLIGCELAMDLCRAGKQVTLVDKAPAILPALLPVHLSAPLHCALTKAGVTVLTGQQLHCIEPHADGLRISLEKGIQFSVDDVISATGLQPETTLARQAGLAVNQGIQVNQKLQTSDPAIFALGDCAEINGQCLPYLQPGQLSALTLAQNLTGQDVTLSLPPALVKVKTPSLPLQLAGQPLREDLHWKIAVTTNGMAAQGYDNDETLCAFVASEERIPESFGWLRQLAGA